MTRNPPLIFVQLLFAQKLKEDFSLLKHIYFEPAAQSGYQRYYNFKLIFK